jgi:large subunit ribosomal protein L4
VTTLKKYDLTGKEIGEHEIEDSILNADFNMQMVKDYLVAIRKNKRQWSANTKTRAEVNKTKRKPHAQKGTGRARQGSLAAPHFKGGGVAFGPKPKFDQHVKINKKEKRKAIRLLICDKIKNNSLHILHMPTMKEPKTKKVANFLDKLQIQNKSVLFLGDTPKIEKDKKGESSKKLQHFIKSMQNIPKKSFTSLFNLNGYELASHQQIILLDTAFEQIITLISGDKK